MAKNGQVDAAVAVRDKARQAEKYKRKLARLLQTETEESPTKVPQGRL